MIHTPREALTDRASSRRVQFSAALIVAFRKRQGAGFTSHGVARGASGAGCDTTTTARATSFAFRRLVKSVLGRADTDPEDRRCMAGWERVGAVSA